MARQTYPSDNVEKLLLRFPDGMRDRIREEAERNGRSMNAEIIVRLQRTLDLQDGEFTKESAEPDPQGIQATLHFMSQEISRLASLIGGNVTDVRVLPDGDEEVTVLRKRRPAGSDPSVISGSKTKSKRK